MAAGGHYGCSSDWILCPDVPGRKEQCVIRLRGGENGR